MKQKAGYRIDVWPVLLAALVWGFNWPATRIAVAEVPPWTMRGLTLSLGALALAGVALLRRQSLAVRRDHWPRLVVTGILMVAAFAILTTLAQLNQPTSRTAVLTYTMPVWAVLMARVVLGEPFTPRRVLGVVLGVAGLAALAAPLLRSGNFSIGWVCALGAAVSRAAGMVFTKRYPVQAPPLVVATWQLVVGGLICTGGMLMFEFDRLGQPYSGRTIAALAYSVLFGQAVGYVCWFAGIARVAAGTAAVAGLLAPAIGVFGAMLLLGERPAATDFLGLVLVLAASATVVLPARSARA